MKGEERGRNEGREEREEWKLQFNSDPCCNADGFSSLGQREGLRDFSVLNCTFCYLFH